MKILINILYARCVTHMHIICGFSIFIYMLYMSGTFDFLLYRIELDSGRGGSGRTYIWQTKMMAFSNQLSVLEQLFGIGYIENYGTDDVNLKMVERDYFDIFYREFFL